MTKPKVIKIIKRLMLLSLSLGILLLLTLAYVYNAIQASKLQVPEQREYVFYNITVWNPGSDIQANQDLYISGGQITDIHSTSDSDLESICDGCFVMPGLIDAHIHTPPKLAVGNQELFSLLYLKYGVTTVRDLGQLDHSVAALKERLNSGKLIGPNMYSCGTILDGAPPFYDSYTVVRNQGDARKAVQMNAMNGADCTKVYGNISPDALKGAAEESARLDLPLLGHMPRQTSIADVVDFEIQHYTGIPYLTNPAPKDWAYRSQDLIDMTPTEIDEVLSVMIANNISFLPTNANAMSRLTASDDNRFPASEGFSYVPEFWKIAWDSIVSHPETEAEIQTELEVLPVALSFIRKAHERGIDVLVGTDVVMPYVIPGESLHQQISLMSQAFGSPEMALKAATLTNGQHVDKGHVGKVAIGSKASLLFFKTDPRGDLTNIQNWDYLMVEGRLYTRDEIETAVEQYRQHFRGKLYSKVLNLAYRFLAPGNTGSDP